MTSTAVAADVGNLSDAIDAVFDAPDVGGAESADASAGDATPDATSADEGISADPGASDPSSAEASPDAADASPHGVEGEQPDSGDPPSPDSLEADAATPDDAAQLDATQPGDLPEGVKVTKTKSGAELWNWPKERAQRIYGGYQFAQDAEKILGEPPTREAIQERDLSHQVLNLAYQDFIDPAPEAQASFIQNFLIANAQKAMQAGETGVDPLVAFSDVFPRVIAQTNPQAFDRMSQHVLRASLDRLYDEAVRAGDENLLASVQHLDNKRFGGFQKKADIQARLTNAPKPETEEVLRLRQELASRDQRDMQFRQEHWWGETTAAINGECDKVLSEQIKSLGLDARYKDHPEILKSIQTELVSAISDALKSDPHWRRNQGLEVRAAQNAVSEQARSAIRSRLVLRAANVARTALRGRMATVLENAAQRVKASSGAKHQRLQEASQQRGPGSAAPARSTVTAPLKTTATFNDIKDYEREFESFMNS